MKNWSVFIVVFVSLLFVGCWFPPPPDPVEVQSVSLDQVDLTLVEEATVQLTATVLPEDASNKKVSWQTSDPELAVVDDNGLVTALQSGAVTISAISESGGFESSCVITVLPSAIAVSSVIIDNESISVMEGQSAILSVSILPADATNKNVEWASLDELIATVDENGTVAGVSKGVVTITVTSEDGGLSDSCEVTVTAPAVSVAEVIIDPETLDLETGDSFQLSATVLPADASNKNVEWITSNSSVVTVDNSGNVSAVSEGSATIIIRTEDGNLEDTCTITVSEVHVSSVAMNQSSLILDLSEAAALSATVGPSNATNKAVTWSSSDPNIASVNQSGYVTAVNYGEAEISVCTEDGGIEAVCEVIVRDPDHFITVWDMSLTATNTLTIPIYQTDNNFDIDWGDGTVEHHSGSGAVTHNYSVAGVYTVTITGNCNGFGFDYEFFNKAVNAANLIDIAMWGRVRFHNVGAHFIYCKNLTGFSAPGNPDLSGVTDFHSMFAMTDYFNTDIGDWDLSGATIVSSMFYQANAFNQDISDWDVSNVEFFNYMFISADVFTNGGNPEGLENWDVDESLGHGYFIRMFEDCPLNPIPSWYVN